ncbi:short-chain dehydrogenase [Botrytis cinerea]|uniref:Similar to short chain dehydrogenase/reductase n=1 Tax=Botryotinia fuckeliana (strain T4) TaxID=999810 RepID=G2XVG5_BOTF4|nr:similar to short chain dehydrogenase/reductase [Botrytis cinerea T4]
MAPLTRASVALITASSAGLGAATARLFASHGVRVIVNYHSSYDKAQDLVVELGDLARKTLSSNEETEGVTAIKADMSKKDEVERLVKESMEKWGRLDVVVSNHGWTQIRNFQDLDDNVVEEDWDRCFNMNVKSHLWLFHAVKPHLEKTDGSFISTASIAGVKPGGSSMAYSVTKAAQIHLIKSLALTSTIRVNSISPGLMLTDWGLQFPESKVERVKKKSTLGRLATVEEVARQIYCLAESESATGTNSIIDGGIHLGK